MGSASSSAVPSAHLRHRPPGLPASLDYPDLPVGAVLAGAARRFGDRVAFRFGDRALTFAQTWRESCRFAHGLRMRGIGRGDVVALHMPNLPQFVIAYYGTLLAGATFSPCNPLLPPDDLAFQLADSGARAVVTLDLFAAAVAQIGDRTRLEYVIVTDLAQATDPTSAVDLAAVPAVAGGAQTVDFAAVGAGQPDTAPEVEIDPARDLAHIAYTGGTTGRSKGVMLPHRTVLTNVLQFGCWGAGAVPKTDGAGGVTVDQIGAPEEYPVRVGTGVVVNVTPWFHAMGTIGYLNILVLNGTTTVIHPRFDPPAFLADCEKYRATSLGGAPPLFAALMACPDFATRDLSSIRGISSGAAPLPREMLNRLKERFPDATVGEGYGLTEVTMGAVANPAHRSGLRKPGTVGIPVFDTELKIVDPEGPGDDSAEPLPPGTEGEVLLRGPQVMTGYLNRPEETAAVLSPDGWLRTGDIGVLDEDGYLTIVDRKKDMLIYKGYNVYPRELEEILFSHPAVASAAVVGRPDPAVGELATAFVVLNSGAGHVAEADLLAYVNERVVPYKRLREVRFVDEIPVSAAGKVLKRELRRRLIGG